MQKEAIQKVYLIFDQHQKTDIVAKKQIPISK